MADNLLMHLIRTAVKQSGSFDPLEALPYIEEDMTEEQYHDADDFLTWCHDNGNKFGHNIHEVYGRFKRGLKS